MFAGRFSSAIGPVGVDIGAGGLHLLQVREQQQALRVVGAAAVDVPSSDWGDPSTAHTIVDRLRSAIATGGFTGRRCVVSLPRQEIRLQSVRLPTMPDAELRQAVAWEAAQRFGMDRDAMQVDYVRSGAQGGPEGREEVLLIAASLETLERRLHPILEAGLRPVAVDTDFAATARFFSRHCRRETDRTLVRAVVEVGASGAYVMILRGDQIAFCKGFPIGGRQFSRAVAEHLQLDEQAAAELRMARIVAAARAEEDQSIDPSTNRAVFEAVRPLMGDFVKEVVLCLRYYGVTFRGHPPQRIYIGGGDGLEPGLDRMIEQSVKIPTSFDDELGTLDALLGPVRSIISRDPGPATCWAAAAGLAVRGLGRRAATGDGAGPATGRSAA